MTLSVRPVSHLDGIPVYDYPTDPAIPPVTVLRLHPGRPAREGPPHPRRFRSWPTCPPPARSTSWPPVRRSTRPGQVGATTASRCSSIPEPLTTARGRPGRRGAATRCCFRSCTDARGGLLRLQLPPQRKAFWDNVIESMEAELLDRREGFRQAALAHLTLLLHRPGAADRRRGRRSAPQRRTADRRCLRSDRAPHRRAALTLRRRPRTGADPGPSDHGGAPPHRAHRCASGSSSAACPRRARCSAEPTCRSRRSPIASASPIAATSRGLFRGVHGVSPRSWRGFRTGVN